MLKCEGHTLNEGVGHSILHGLSWVSKKVTGSGNDVNPDFVKLIKDENNSNLGISKRGAENYSNKYKALLKTLQKNHKKRMNKTLKGGEIVPVHEVVEALVDACWAYIRFNRHTSTTMEGMFLAKLAYAGGTNIDFARISNQKLASALEAVLWYAKKAGYQTDNGIVSTGWLDLPQGKPVETMWAVINARRDLEQIVEKLKNDPPTTVRFFQEVTVDPHMIDGSLADARERLN